MTFIDIFSILLSIVKLNKSFIKIKTKGGTRVPNGGQHHEKLNHKLKGISIYEQSKQRRNRTDLVIKHLPKIGYRGYSCSVI